MAPYVAAKHALEGLSDRWFDRIILHASGLDKGINLILPNRPGRSVKSAQAPVRARLGLARLLG
jgi:hypothetical protein